MSAGTHQRASWALGPDWGVEVGVGGYNPSRVFPSLSPLHPRYSIHGVSVRTSCASVPFKVLQLPLLVHWNQRDFQWTCSSFTPLSNKKSSSAVTYWFSARLRFYFIVRCSTLNRPFSEAAPFNLWQKLVEYLQKGNITLSWQCEACFCLPLNPTSEKKIQSHSHFSNKVAFCIHCSGLTTLKATKAKRGVKGSAGTQSCAKYWRTEQEQSVCETSSQAKSFTFPSDSAAIVAEIRPTLVSTAFDCPHILTLHISFISSHLTQ